MSGDSVCAGVGSRLGRQLRADHTIVRFGDMVTGGLTAGLGRGLGGRLTGTDAGGGEEAGMGDGVLAAGVGKPVADVVADLGTGPAAGEGGFDRVDGASACGRTSGTAGGGQMVHSGFGVAVQHGAWRRVPGLGSL